MITYSSRSARALGYLKKSYNDVEIYVEDTSSQRMWLLICRKALRESVRLTSVNMLGGRTSVIDACRLDQAEDGRKRIYIIDGDFDYLAGIGKPKLKYLYRIPAYCIENLLICSRTINEIAADAGNLAFDAVDQCAERTSKFLEGLESQFSALFVVYAVARALSPSTPTVSSPVESLIGDRRAGFEVSWSSVAARARQVIRAARPHVCARGFSLKRKQISSRSRSLRLEKKVCGKNYLMPIIHIFLQKNYKYRGTREQFLIHLAKEFRPSDAPAFCRRLRSVG